LHTGIVVLVLKPYCERMKSYTSI